MKPLIRFSSFRSRLLVFFAGLLIIVQSGAFLLVSQANISNARALVREALRVNVGVFNRLVEERAQHLLEAARLLSGDFAFKSAYFTDNRGTVLSAMENHLTRVGSAEIMLLVSLEGAVLADTRHLYPPGSDLPWPELLDAALADEYGETSGVMLIDKRPYQLMVVPLLTPDLEAWILIGFPIDDAFAADMGRLLLSEISVLQRESGGGGWRVAATTQPRLDLLKAGFAAHLPQVMSDSVVMTHQDQAYLSLGTPLLLKSKAQVVVLMQRSLREALAPYERLRLILSSLFAVGLAVSIIGAMFIARSVTRPVQELAEGVRRIEQGDYNLQVRVTQSDEIGRLAQAFNHMGRGLAEKEKVRTLLGKVVSPAIAEELLSKDIELGGEEREVTILFSDARNFTSLSENYPPQQILEMLNLYLTAISEVVEAHHGVVDKYIGDAVMALFGAPVARADKEALAVRTALGMQAALQELTRDFAARSLPCLETGIGIHTSVVVAGNMGSRSRLNYTVVGDGVNLASRLEGLSKVYGEPIIVSAATRGAAPAFAYLELDRVRVKGKNEAVTIYSVLGEQASALSHECALQGEALGYFRKREWDAAAARFEQLHRDCGGRKVYALYLERVERFRQNPPAPGWDGVHNLTEK